MLLQVPHFFVEHSSHFRLIERGVPSVSDVSQLVYNFPCLASPRVNPQVPIGKIRSQTPDLTHRVRLHYPERLNSGYAM